MGGGGHGEIGTYCSRSIYSLYIHGVNIQHTAVSETVLFGVRLLVCTATLADPSYLCCATAHCRVLSSAYTRCCYIIQ
jgi:hypothetical protein